MKYYEEDYKKLLWIPLILLILAIAQIGYQAYTTGDFINKGISLKGGTTITINTNKAIDIKQLSEKIKNELNVDNDVREIKIGGAVSGLIIETGLTAKEDYKIKQIIEIGGIYLGKELKKEDYNVETVGSALGESFFKDTIRALIIAFLFMGLVVLIYFKSWGPSMAVIAAALSDIIVTVAITNILGFKINTGGIAAFLMLIGYSVDTDILLSTRLLKTREGTMMDRIYGAMKTGLTMTFSTIIAVIIALLVSTSEVIQQIMLILLIGLFVDLINTWIQNVGILRWYLDKKRRN